LEIENPLALWLRPTLFLFDLDVVRRAYDESYKLLPKDIRDALRDKKSGYLGDVWRSLDLLLCMHAYRDLQYGPKRVRDAPMLRKRVKLGWIAYNINAAQKLLDHWDILEKELWTWYNNEGYRYRNKKIFEDFINFLHGYIQTTIAELAVLYVYLYNNRIVMPLGFMQHLVTLGSSGPTLGDLIDIETLTFIEVKSRRPGRQYGSDLLSLTINTRLPSAVAIPRYKVDTVREEVDKGVIVVELYTLAVAGRKKPWIEHKGNLEAPIEDELKPLMKNVSLLEDNAWSYLREVKERSHR